MKFRYVADQEAPYTTTVYGVTFEKNGAPVDIPEDKMIELKKSTKITTKPNKVPMISKLIGHPCFVVVEEGKKKSGPKPKAESVDGQ